MLLKDKVIVITGASSGLGASIAEKVAAEGAQVVLVGRSKEKLEKVETKITEKKGNVSSSVCDIRNLNQIQTTVKAIFTKYKTIDILVNNAGIWTDNEIEQSNPERRKEAFATNALGNIEFTYEVLPHFIEKNVGYVFNVISSAGVADISAGDNKFWQTYGATKWAMTGFTKTLRDKLNDTKIKVTGFFPGGFDSDLYESAKKADPHKQPWMMKTEDVADIVVFALTRPSDVLMERIVVTKVSE